MTSKLTLLGALLPLLAPVAAFANDPVSGMQYGWSEGQKSGGPIGGLIGGAGGALVGGIAGSAELVGGGVQVLTGVSPMHEASLTSYARQYGIPSHSFSGTIASGMRIPKGVTLYHVPAQYGDPRMLFTVVNGHVVIVHPRSRRVLQVLPA